MRKEFSMNAADKCGVAYYNITKAFPVFYTSDLFIVVIEYGCGKVIINDKEFSYRENSVFAASFTDYFSVIPEEETGLYKFEFSFSI